MDCFSPHERKKKKKKKDKEDYGTREEIHLYVFSFGNTSKTKYD